MLIKRQLLMFFRDKAAVFFSLMLVLIIFVLYMLFLGDVLASPLQERFGESESISRIVGGIMLGGLVAIASVTSCLGALEIFVADKAKAAMDFMTSPISRRKVSLQYVLGSSVVGFLMTLAALVLVIIYLTANGAALPSPQDLMLLLFATVLSVLCGNAMMFLVIQFVKGSNAFAAVSGVVSSLLGFVMGVFVPAAVLPAPVQWVIRIFPMSHSAAMFRQIFADGELEQLFYNSSDQYLESFRVSQGVVHAYGNFVTDFWFSAAVLAISTVIFFALALVFMKKKYA